MIDWYRYLQHTWFKARRNKGKGVVRGVEGRWEGSMSLRWCWVSVGRFWVATYHALATNEVITMIQSQVLPTLDRFNNIVSFFEKG